MAYCQAAKIGTKSHFCKSVTGGVTHYRKTSYCGYFLFPIR